ncbi:MAG: hypothetical protein DYG98_19145 [Haliscomenobacteraceae bacterium CHB4]|nr:Hercynine oxygenase [Saprospiraceae bacterium]MCE7925176.1 hypothetical protein [Haliscomenobacteraceae bacterium CHB4]
MPKSPYLDTLPSNFSGEMIHVPGGSFLMGSDEYEEMLGWEGPAHQVTVGDFYIGKFPVTQEFWIAVMGKGNNHCASSKTILHPHRKSFRLFERAQIPHFKAHLADCAYH